jgi:hypothetical protein
MDFMAALGLEWMAEWRALVDMWVGAVGDGFGLQAGGLDGIKNVP